MILQVLVSTMNQTDYSLAQKMNIKGKCLIINQAGADVTVPDTNPDIKLLTFNERGLSKSRNRALENARYDISLIADDDIIYNDSYEKIIIEQFKKNPSTDIITFQLSGLNGKHKEYSKKEKKLGFITAMKVTSFEIAFRTGSIKKAGIRFNDILGAGAKYKMGEENVFLFDCLRKGLRIKYVPIEIGKVYLGDSTWFDGYNSGYFFSRGGSFAAMSKRWAILLILQFAVRKYSLYKNESGFFPAIAEMLKGRKTFLEDIANGV
ncbi:MAG: glycosyltransferase family 2 protein [Oscillospiraceae bacterium]|nr:glycosyltransferase family 2 protein [Oscillospiraceae bacterium]